METIKNTNNEELSQDTTDNNVDEITFEVETDNLAESLLRNIVRSYEQAFNKHNEKNEIKFTVTITNHKVATENGYKNCAYLRLERSIREKGPAKLVPNPDPTKPDIVDEGWDSKVIHQEVHFFKSMQERLNSAAPWKETLFLNCMTRLISAGLEYAELLHRLKPTKEAMKKELAQNSNPPTEEERLNKIGLVSSTQMPKPLTPDEQKYAEWAKNNREV